MTATRNRCKIAACRRVYPHRSTKRCESCGERVCQNHSRGYAGASAPLCQSCLKPMNLKARMKQDNPMRNYTDADAAADRKRQHDGRLQPEAQDAARIRQEIHRDKRALAAKSARETTTENEKSLRQRTDSGTKVTTTVMRDGDEWVVQVFRDGAPFGDGHYVKTYDEAARWARKRRNEGPTDMQKHQLDRDLLKLWAKARMPVSPTTRETVAEFRVRMLSEHANACSQIDAPTTSFEEFVSDALEAAKVDHEPVRRVLDACEADAAADAAADIEAEARKSNASHVPLVWGAWSDVRKDGTKAMRNAIGDAHSIVLILDVGSGVVTARVWEQTGPNSSRMVAWAEGLPADPLGAPRAGEAFVGGVMRALVMKGGAE